MSVNIFISHISEERELAEILKRHLTADFAATVNVFVSSDLEGITAGSEWLRSIEKALDVASFELILCSRVSTSRPWVNFEVGAAWLKHIPIVPICHSGLQVSDLPMPYVIWNGIEANQERDLERLYRSIAKTLAIDCPALDFAELAAEVQSFEAKYAASTRMRGKGGALVDLSQGERLVGSWKGEGFDIEIPDILEYKQKLHYELTLNLQRRQSLISGEFIAHAFERDRTLTSFIELVNVSGEYFYFKYWVAIPHANHCGFMLTQLSIAGDELEGMFLTNKIFERQIGLGKLLFRRQ
jgi:TIR domain-containing protein